MGPIGTDVRGPYVRPLHIFVPHSSLLRCLRTLLLEPDHPISDEYQTTAATFSDDVVYIVYFRDTRGRPGTSNSRGELICSFTMEEVRSVFATLPPCSSLREQVSNAS